MPSAGAPAAAPRTPSIWPPSDQGHLHQDPLNFSDMSQGDEWFCDHGRDVAAQVARAELQAARMAANPPLPFEAKDARDLRAFESRAPFTGHAQGLSHDSQQHTHVQQHHQHPHQHPYHQHPHQHLHHYAQQGHGHHVSGMGNAFTQQQQQQQTQTQSFANGMRFMGGQDSSAGMHGGSMGGRMGTGLGGVEYMNMSDININGPGQERWMSEVRNYEGYDGGRKHQQLADGDMHHHLLSAQAVSAQGEEDGSSNILKMMFGVALS